MEMRKQSRGVPGDLGLGHGRRAMLEGCFREIHRPARKARVASGCANSFVGGFLEWFKGGDVALGPDGKNP